MTIKIIQKMPWLLCLPLYLVSVDSSAQPWPKPPVGKATASTQTFNHAFSHSLDLQDGADFEAAQRGFVASADDPLILNTDGSVAWNLSAYEFITGDAPETVNPSLWRQAKLNAMHGLYEVVDGIWQVRGYDLAVMTLIRGETGWIVIDPLTTPATAKAGLALANQHLGERPVSAIVYTHSHADHFGGVGGILPTQGQNETPIPIVGPEGFSEAAVKENLMAGNAMIRRSVLQFGSLLPNGPSHHVGSGLGQRLSMGQVGLIIPTHELSARDKTMTLDGVVFEFMDAAATEAPAELVFFLPQFNALCGAEVISRNFHNLLTPRGAKIRDALRWSQAIDDLIVQYGDRAAVLFSSHHWPTWGSENITELLTNQRDRYRHVHDQTLRLANQGFTMHEIAELLEEPAFTEKDFSVRGYYGTLNHNSKAVYQFYFGWWDGVPANYHRHPPEAESKRYVAAMGGVDAAGQQGIQAFEAGDYRWAATIFNHLVFADPENEPAKAWLAASYEQMGFQSESGAWRNYYLGAARELRQELPRHLELTSVNQAFLQAVPSLDLFNALAVRFNPDNFALSPAKLGFTFVDRRETITLDITQAVVFPRQGEHSGIETMVSMHRDAFDQLLLGELAVPDLIANGQITIRGEPALFFGFLSALDSFDPWFNVVIP